MNNPAGVFLIKRNFSTLFLVIFRVNQFKSPSERMYLHSSDTVLLPNVIRETQKFLFEREEGRESVISVEHLFSSVEKNTYSARELCRLHAAHAVVMLSHLSLYDYPALRFRPVFEFAHEKLKRSVRKCRKLKNCEAEVMCRSPALC